MVSTNSVFGIKDCFGCGVCSSSCGKNAISIRLNRDGFYQPVVDETKCVQCGICVDVCAFLDDTIVQNNNIHSWAAWSNDEQIRKKCSSGGVGFEIGKQLIEKGYNLVGCRYDIKEQRAEHYIATNIAELSQSIGSKYLQSYTEEAFKQIKRKHEKYLVTGTPCQIDSFRRMVQKFHCEGNFVLMDFFCHCVPSMWAWKAYIKKLEPRIGNITHVSWRNKLDYGWHDSWLMLVEGKKESIQSRWSQGDIFYKLLLGDYCLGPQCQKQCKYKYDKSSADIRIGDLWGNTYKDDEKGTSALISFTERGYNIVQELNDVTLVEHPFEVVAEGQMRQNAKPALMKPIIMFLLKHGISLNSLLFKTVYNTQRLINVFKKAIRRII